MFFGINQICLTDLLNSQINDIYSSQPSEKGWQRHVSRAPCDEKNKRNPRGEEKKKSSIKYRTYECMKCEMWETSKQSFVKTCMHNNCMRLYGNLAAEYATHLKKKNLKMKLTWILALLVKPANFSASSFENVVYFPAISNLAKLCLPRIGPYKKPKIRKLAEILSSRGKSCHILPWFCG